MKKYLLMVWISSILVLSWCNKTPSPVENDLTSEATQNEVTQNEVTQDLSLNNPEMCSNVIKTYLKNVDLKWKWTKKVKKWNEIVVHYVWRTNESEVFDTSVEEVAKGCGKYNSARNYNEWLAFTVGAGQMIPGFDKGVEGMKVWQTKTITIPAKEAYGEWSKENVAEIDRWQLPPGEYQKGMQLMSQMWQTFTVVDANDKTVTLDWNHELAGKELIFDITIVEIK